jgi:transposase
LEKKLNNPISIFLPEDLLTHFELVVVKELGEVSSKKMIYHIHLVEKNQLPSCYNSLDYESKGFYPEKIVQDFPIRGKAVYLLIKRRRWRNKESSKGIKSDYSFIAEGSKITIDLSDFLKGTGRNPRRHH